MEPLTLVTRIINQNVDKRAIKCGRLIRPTKLRQKWKRNIESSDGNSLELLIISQIHAEIRQDHVHNVHVLVYVTMRIGARNYKVI